MLDTRYKSAKNVLLVMDNLNTYKVASLYAAFPPKEAKRLADRLEIHFTPNHGSWLNVVKIERRVFKETVSCRQDRLH